MTTEYDFQTALDTNPSDWQTRLVFADWLDEKGDKRGFGYRVLGQIRKYPTVAVVSPMTSDGLKSQLKLVSYGTLRNQNVLNANWRINYEHKLLPHRFFMRMVREARVPVWKSPWWKYYSSRQKAEESAIEAILSLPQDHVLLVVELTTR